MDAEDSQAAGSAQCGGVCEHPQLNQTALDLDLQLDETMPRKKSWTSAARTQGRNTRPHTEQVASSRLEHNYVNTWTVRSIIGIDSIADGDGSAHQHHHLSFEKATRTIHMIPEPEQGTKLLRASIANISRAQGVTKAQSATVQLISILAAISLIFSILAQELRMYSEAMNFYVSVLRLLVTMMSMRLAVALLRYHSLRAKAARMDGAGSSSNSFTVARMIKVFFEIVVALAHCPPGLINVHIDIELPGLLQTSKETSQLQIDHVLTALATFRGLLLVRSLRHHLRIEDIQLVLASKLNRIDLNSMGFWAKFCIQVYPFMTVGLGSAVIVMEMAYLLRLVEHHQGADKSQHTHLGHIFNQIWFTCVTLSSVGYGDSVPQTHLGRAVASFTLILGFLVSSLLLAVFSRFIQLGNTEQRAVDQFLLHAQQRKLKAAAADVIAQWWQLHKMIIKHARANSERRNYMRPHLALSNNQSLREGRLGSGGGADE
eukprot:CAMPEP_0179416338 /NCGR_PEP_ID=MMETSP0799-20121207/6740_1 /TAXON_ID=46947 /ORGANISM="Geminigera cryophila, Strain CCMP2564" /LENGTH=487 /DNA_ID=CAMNT_0021189193 /DNA_START=61 /DNA_END=1521 /DNA_ORIENTATION=-